ncbi:MAG: hypothetical protein LC667_14095 [Thioalkalivibrio sp.]|nr:hypothetical protein [Thioalkalivibrio sp.]
MEVTHKDESTYSYELNGWVAPMTFGTLATRSNTVFPTGEMRGWQLISLEKTLFPPEGRCE